MASLLSIPIMILLLVTISMVLICGVMPPGHGNKHKVVYVRASTRAFTVTGFPLPVAMAYSNAADVQAQVPGIASSEVAAQTFVDRLVMQTILAVKMSELKCIIVGNTVTGICCTTMASPLPKCEEATKVTIIPVSTNHTALAGNLTTTNFIMTNWSRAMWQNVVNRAIRMLASGPFGSHFFSASATVGGS
ncbi:hypothetical protein KIN20_005124 [Parelaphostrongylus tenuis]|uniref:Uncharacterized protein n=1 Tax=Parelaphostrongylus tenuis TaxID=148309 RepID=A0AAD5M1M8_PARTN|nr:hypothetical protein KIN20_005124 [Parelaphostrongylus tenuis]